MKKLLLVLTLFVMGCPKKQPPGPLTGAATPRAAVEQFMLAIRAQDLQAISSVWGNSKGPARDQGMTREELEKRTLLMVCFFTHDSYRITGLTSASTKKEYITAELTKGNLVRSAEFTVERGPSNRWYASVADISTLQDLCRPPRQNRTGND